MLRYINLIGCILIGLCGELLTLPQPQQQQQPQFKHITQLPSNIPHCTESDAGVNECIRNGLQFVISKLKTGVPEINVPRMDPFVIDKANFNFANNVINGRVSLRNLEVNGLSETTLKNVGYQRNGNKIDLHFVGSIPKLFVKGNHKANVENARISSKGTFAITLTEVNFTGKIKGELREQNGHQVVQATNIELDPTVGNMKLQATGLFEEPALNDAIVDSINQNWREFYKMIVTESHQTWEPAVIKVANNFFSYLPFDLLVTFN